MTNYPKITRYVMEKLLDLRDSMIVKLIPITLFNLNYDGEDYAVVVRISTFEEQADCRRKSLHNPLVSLKFLRKRDGSCFECFANRAEFVDKDDGEIKSYFGRSYIKIDKPSFTYELLSEIGRVCPQEAYEINGEEKNILINQMNELNIEEKKNKYLYGVTLDTEYSHKNLRYNEEKAFLLYPDFYRTAFLIRKNSIPLDSEKGYIFVFGDEKGKQIESVKLFELRIKSMLSIGY